MRGHLVQRYKHSWSVVIDTKDAAGKRKRTWVTVKGNKKAAQTKLNELLHQMDKSTFVDPSKLTLAEWLPQWLELAQSDKREKPLRASTVARYQNVLDVRLLESALGKMPLQKITAVDIERYYAAQKVSASTLTLDHAILHSAFKKAKASHYVSSNPVSDVEHRPRANRHEKSDEAKRHAWSGPEAAAFLGAAKKAGVQPAAFYGLALDAGMRKSELGGLR
jgi:integrase